MKIFNLKISLHWCKKFDIDACVEGFKKFLKYIHYKKKVGKQLFKKLSLHNRTL